MDEFSCAYKLEASSLEQQAEVQGQPRQQQLLQGLQSDLMVPHTRMNLADVYSEDIHRRL